MFVDEILFAPITDECQTDKEVYLPKGKWILTKDKSEYEGGRKYTIHAEIDEFIAFVKAETEVINLF